MEINFLMYIFSLKLLTFAIFKGEYLKAVAIFKLNFRSEH